MKKICLLFVIFPLTVYSYGQNRKAYVFLKDGSVLKGRIMESGSAENIRLKSAGNFWVFDKDEIEQIHYTRKQFVHPSNSDTTVSNHTQAGIMAGNNDNSQDAPFYLHSTLNYRVDKKIRIGFGSGVEFLKETHLPIFANFEYRFRNNWFSPYLFLKVGYCFPVEDSRTAVYDDIVPDYWYSPSYIYDWSPSGDDEVKPRGGLLLNPGFGFVNMFSWNFGMSFSAGYRFTRLRYKCEKSNRLDVDFNRLSLTLGIIFN